MVILLCPLFREYTVGLLNYNQLKPIQIPNLIRLDKAVSVYG